MKGNKWGHSGFRMEAHACRIHGMIQRSKGRMTVREISEALNIRRTTVDQIIRERGWKVERVAGEEYFGANEGPRELNFDERE